VVKSDGFDAGSIKTLTVWERSKAEIPVIPNTALEDIQYTLAGKKPVDTSVWINGEQVVSLNGETSWSYVVALEESSNEFVISVRDAIGLDSSRQTIVIDYNTPVPALEPAPAVSLNGYYTLSGSKVPDTGIWLNGQEIIPLNNATEWSFETKLDAGVNALEVYSQNQFGIKSSALNFEVTYEPSGSSRPTWLRHGLSNPNERRLCRGTIIFSTIWAWPFYITTTFRSYNDRAMT